jgi:hypothetical protein
MRLDLATVGRSILRRSDRRPTFAIPILEVTGWKPDRLQVVSIANRSDSLSALWTRFRRLVASIMLVAVASFVSHTGAMAGFHQHGPGSTECATTASSGHVHQAAHQRDEPPTHAHAEGMAPHHVEADHDRADVTGDDATDDRQAATGDTCCANVCAVALTAFTPDTPSAPLGLAAELLPARQDGATTHLDGVKRPPRTPGIA